MSLSVVAFPLNSSVIQTLTGCDLLQLRDFECITAVKLSEITKLDLETCCEVVEVVRHLAQTCETETCLDVVEHELRLGSITCFNEKLDELLGTGFPLRKIIEIYGEASSGKTQLCMQLCVNVQIPKNLGGVEGEALYIDCEHLNVSRFEEIASLTVKEINSLKKQEEYDEQIFYSFNSKSVTDNLRLLTCKSPEELSTALLNKLEPFLLTHPKVKLVVIDSISYHFRYGFDDDYFERTKNLLEIAQKLKHIAVTRNVCIVITNHVTYRPEVDKDVPALGASWSHCCNIRLLLERDKTSNLRFVSTTKNFPKKGIIPFEISAKGFR